MRAVFADTNYWIPKINPQDQWHARVIAVELEIGLGDYVTTESVLLEVLNYFSSYRSETKRRAAMIARHILTSPEIEVVPQADQTLLQGIELYEARLDKGYSLTDCISMNLMRERRITDILTHDRHFAQEGFTVLM